MTVRVRQRPRFFMPAFLVHAPPAEENQPNQEPEPKDLREQHFYLFT